jgi:hypothetical protein
MNVVHAEWELRNLGVVCFEVTVEQTDSFESVHAAIASLNVQYLVVRVPCGCSEILDRLQGLGLRVVETVFRCEHNGRFPLTSPQIRLLSACAAQRMSDSDLECLKNEISDGMFTDDRVSNDAVFEKVSSRDRYWNWVRDEISRGGSVYTVSYNTETIGFFCLSPKSGNRASVCLSGLYSKHRRSGIGYVPHCLGVQTAIDNGASRVITTVSANNSAALALHMQLQHRIIQSWYTLVLHRPLLESIIE